MALLLLPALVERDVDAVSCHRNIGFGPGGSAHEGARVTHEYRVSIASPNIKASLEQCVVEPNLKQVTSGEYKVVDSE